MKKLLFPGACVLATMFSMISCKPQLHSDAPTPSNYRILSYSRTTNAEVNLPIPLLPRPIHESFRFYYLKDGRVDRIVYATNDTANGNGAMNIAFAYYHDTIVKNYYDLSNNQLKRSDTFMQNSGGFIVSANTPAPYKSREKTSYEYLGQLLTRQQTTTSYRRDGDTLYSYRGTTINGPLTTYTSDNGDFLKHTYETSLQANFLQNRYDTLKKAYWVYGAGDTVKHDIPFNSYKDILTGYQQKPLILIVTDSKDSTDTVGYLGAINNMGDLWFNEGYEFYTTMANRPGDWLQIQSFTMFGSNIYRNKHLVKKIYSVKGSMDITYSIDAYSKITQVITNEKDEYLNTYSTVTDVQYEIFQ